MSSVSNTARTELLVDVELVSVEATTSTSPIRVESIEAVAEEQPLHHTRNHLNGGVVKSYQSTAPTKQRTISTTSDESVLLPDIAYTNSQSNTISFQRNLTCANVLSYNCLNFPSRYTQRGSRISTLIKQNGH